MKAVKRCLQRDGVTPTYPEVDSLRDWHINWSENEWFALDIMAITVGLVGGLVAVIFRELVGAINRVFFGPVLSALPGGDERLILLPVMGGLVAGLMVFRLAPEIKGDGIPALMESLHKKGGKIRKRTGFVLLFSSAMTIGSGGSAGRDSPIAHIGASVGSLIGQTFNFTAKDVQILTICGLVAGLAGTFNAPLGSAIFGMEVVMRRFRMVDAVPILLSAVIGAAVASTFLGQTPAFEIRVTNLALSELWLCFALGAVFGVLSAIWVHLLYAVQRLFSLIPLKNELKPGLGGLVAGVGGVYLFGFGVMGVGYEGIDRVLDMVLSGTGQIEVELILFMLTLAAVKGLATAFTLGSGASGGSIGPTLYVGAMVGATFGLLFGDLFSVSEGHAAMYGLIGAGALFAGSAGAPLTCVVMIPEMAANYALLLPMMISCASSYGFAQILLRGSTMYTLDLNRKGVKLDASESLLKSVLVQDAMKREVVTVSPEMTIKEVKDRILEYNYRGFPVLRGGELEGIITFDDVRKVPEDKLDQIKAGTVAVKTVITAYPDENVKEIMDRLYDNNVGRLLVVERDNPKKVVGIVTKTDTIDAYETAAAKRETNSKRSDS